MKHLIDKSALVAEIERKKEEEVSYDENGGFASWADHNHYSTLESVEDFINTLEVKEVDLEKYYHDFLQKEWFNKNCCRTVSEMMAFTAKHFFELGMQVSDKAQKRE